MRTEPDPDLLPVLAAGFVAALLVVPWLSWPLAPLAAGAALIGLLARSPVLLGAALGWLAVASIPQGPALNGAYVVQGVVMGAPTGKQADVALSRTAPVPGLWSPAAGRVRVRFPEGPPAPGTAVAVFGRAGPFMARALPGDPDMVANARRAGVRTMLWAETWAPIGGELPVLRPHRDVERGVDLGLYVGPCGPCGPCGDGLQCVGRWLAKNFQGSGIAWRRESR